MVGNISANQLFNMQGLTANQRKVVEDSLQEVQAGGDQKVNNALKFAAQKVKDKPNFSIQFGALPQKGDAVAFGQTMTKQVNNEAPPEEAKVIFDKAAIFRGDERTQKRNFLGTFANELASVAAATNTATHEFVSDLMEAQFVKAWMNGKNGKPGKVSGQELVAQANEQRGGNVKNMMQLSAYAKKSLDATDTTVDKLQALDLVDDDQAAAMKQAAGITAARPIDKEAFKAQSLAKSGSQLSLEA